MALFGKAVSLDEVLEKAMLQTNGHSRRQVANEQETIRRTLSPEESVSFVGLDRAGRKVLVATDKRFLLFSRESLQQEVPLSSTSGIKLSNVSPTCWQATASPGISVQFDTFAVANAFLVAIDPRDIPVLYPHFFRGILIAADLPITPTNIARLVERVAMAIGVGGAMSYFMQSNDQAARQSFEERFRGGGAPERILHSCDDMIDWLWKWHATCHNALRELVPDIERLMVGEKSPIRSDNGEVPPLEGSGFPS